MELRDATIEIEKIMMGESILPRVARGKNSTDTV
jgi:hypothetical protein